MIRVLGSLFLLAALAVANPVRAFTPESGWWWSPDYDGIGFALEVQDDLLFVVAFAYGQAANGAPVWYAAGPAAMTHNRLFERPLYNRVGGTCLGCAFRAPGAPTSANANIKIEFTTATTGKLTWGPRRLDVQRFDYGLSRTPGFQPGTELWLGEWQVVLDFHAEGGPFLDYPFFGDVWVFDAIDQDDPETDIFVGCRPENSEVRECDQFALDNHSAAGFHCPGCGHGDKDVTFIIVNDGPEVGTGIQQYWVFEVEAGTNQFQGEFKWCNIADLTPDPVTGCLDRTNHPWLKARGWRSASAEYILGNNRAPNAAPGDQDMASSRRSGSVTSRMAALGLHRSDASSQTQQSVPMRAKADVIRNGMNRAIGQLGKRAADSAR